jgi:hypothetical protein
MPRKIPSKDVYLIRDPRNFHDAMRSDIKLLHDNRAYVSMTTIIMCCLDALAAGPGKATRGKFEAFVLKHFSDLCHALSTAYPGGKGEAILYDNYRNGFAHLRGPKQKFAIAEDHELSGSWVEMIEVDGVGQLVAINVDRLSKEFQELLVRIGRK